MNRPQLPPQSIDGEEEKQLEIASFRDLYYDEEHIRNHHKFRKIHGLIADLAKNNHYEVLDYISRGTYSQVYRVRSLVSEKIYAMKRMIRRSKNDFVPRSFLKEVLIAHDLKHPNVSEFKTCCTTTSEEGHTVFNMVLEHYPYNLDFILFSSGASIKLEDTKYLIHSLLRGLEYIHSKNILHRDLKPSNICISHEGVLKVGDFGLASYFGANEAANMSCDVCTPGYAAPELLFGCTKYGTEIDVWSAGIIAAEVMLREKVMNGGNRSEQLLKTATLFGSISEENWEGCEKLPFWNDFKAEVTDRGLGTVFGRLETAKSQYNGIQLVRKMTQLCPDQRAFVREAKNDKWFLNCPHQGKHIKHVIDNIKRRQAARRRSLSNRARHPF